MELDDFVESEVAMAVAAVSLLFSPKVRNLLRRGAVMGLGELLKLGHTLSSSSFSSTRGRNDDGLEDIVAHPEQEHGGSE
jgi:hypothetical protein